VQQIAHSFAQDELWLHRYSGHVHNCRTTIVNI